MLADIATATRTAVQREQHLRFHSLATRLGDPERLEGPVLDSLAAGGIDAQRWWDAQVAEQELIAAVSA